MAALLRRTAVSDSAFCSQVDVSTSDGLPWLNTLMDYPQVGELHRMFPGLLQGGR